MKINSLKYLILLLILFQQNLFSNDNSEKEGNALYASFSFHPIVINRDITYIAGGRLLYGFAENYSVGIGSFNMVSRNIKANFIDTVTGSKPVLEYNYFSGDFEYAFNPKDFYVWSAKASLNLAHVRYNLISTEKNLIEGYTPDYGQNWFFFIEPAALATLNLQPWFKISFSLGYRIALNGNYIWGNTVYNNKKLSGISSGVYFKLGNF